MEAPGNRDLDRLEVTNWSAPTCGTTSNSETSRRDPRVALSFDVPKEPGNWINPYAVIYARATVEPSSRIWDLMTRHAKVYVSPDAQVPAPEGSEPGFIVGIRSQRMAASDRGDKTSL